MLVSELVGLVLGGGGLMAIVGLIYNIWSGSKSAKDARLSDIEHRIGTLNEIDAAFKERSKQIHYRLDVIESSQNKLEARLDSDIKDVKRSIEKLSDLIVKALSKGG